MTRPVVSKIMQDAGWDRDEFDRRDTMIITAAMQVFPTRRSWCNRKNDIELSEKLITAMQPVAVQFSKLGKNGWYRHGENDRRKGRDYTEGLSHACAQWARGQMSYRISHFSGWWDTDGSKTEESSDRSLVLKLRLGSRSSDDQTETPSTALARSHEVYNSTSPLSTPPASENGDSESFQKDFASAEKVSGPTLGDQQRGQTKLDRLRDDNAQKPIEDQNRVKQSAGPRQPAVAESPPNQYTPNGVPVPIDWADLSIAIDASHIGRDDLWILMHYLLPDSNTAPTWRDFPYRKFLDELTEVTDSHKLEQGQHDLIYMDGMRRHPIRNKHDYAMMLKKFSNSYSSGEDTIHLKLEGSYHKDKRSNAVKTEPLVIDMSAFKPHFSIAEDQNESHPRDTAEVTESVVTEGNGAEAEGPTAAARTSAAPPKLPLQSDNVEHSLEEEDEERLLGTMVNRAEGRFLGSSRKRTPTLKRREMDEARDATAKDDFASGQASKRRFTNNQDSGYRMRLNQGQKSAFVRRPAATSGQPGV